jgi:hypothetical protein
VPNQEGKMALVNSDDETAKGSQVLGPEKSKAREMLPVEYLENIYRKMNHTIRASNAETV